MRRRIINLTFHGIGEPERALEPGEEQVWLDSDQFQSALDSVVGRSDVRITFDDGNASDVEQALPGLRQRGLTATFFIVAGRLSEPGFLDDRGVRALAAAGITLEPLPTLVAVPTNLPVGSVPAPLPSVQQPVLRSVSRPPAPSAITVTRSSRP